MDYCIETTAASLMIEPEELLDILELCFNDIAANLAEIQKALNSSDLSALDKLLHALKGLTSNFRMESLSNLAIALQESVKAGDLGLVPEQLWIFQKEFLLIKEQVEQHPLAQSRQKAG